MIAAVLSWSDHVALLIGLAANTVWLWRIHCRLGNGKPPDPPVE